MLHIAYKGNSVALADVLGGHVSMMFDTITTGLPHTQNGKLRLLAVTSAERSPLAPNTPDDGMRRACPGTRRTPGTRCSARRRCRGRSSERLNGEINKAFNDPAFRDQFVAQGVRFVGGSPEQLEAHMRAETKRWSEVLAAIGMKRQ